MVARKRVLIIALIISFGILAFYIYFLLSLEPATLYFSEDIPFPTNEIFSSKSLISGNCFVCGNSCTTSVYIIGCEKTSEDFSCKTIDGVCTQLIVTKEERIKQGEELCKKCGNFCINRESSVPCDKVRTEDFDCYYELGECYKG